MHEWDPVPDLQDTDATEADPPAQDEAPVEPCLPASAHRRMALRRQVAMGKASVPYALYLRSVPIAERTPAHPVTPPTSPRLPVRPWLRLYQAWRRALHRWHPGASRDLGSPVGPVGAEDRVAPSRTGRGSALLSMGDVEANPGPGPEADRRLCGPCGPPVLDGPWSEFCRAFPHLIHEWEVLEGAPVGPGPSGEPRDGWRQGFMWLRHGLCQEVIFGQTAACLVHHRCLPVHSHLEAEWECPGCSRRFFCLPRVFDLHFRQCPFLFQPSSSDSDSDSDQDDDDHGEDDCNPHPGSNPAAVAASSSSACTVGGDGVGPPDGERPASVDTEMAPISPASAMEQDESNWEHDDDILWMVPDRPDVAFPGPLTPPTSPLLPRPDPRPPGDHALAPRASGGLLAAGDVESNPGPGLSLAAGGKPRPGATLSAYASYPGGGEDLMFRLDKLPTLLQALGVPEGQGPARDAFAQAHNALFPDFWSPDDDGLAQGWLEARPIWANPPFSLLPALVSKLQAEGGHAIVLAPGWSPVLGSLQALAKRVVVLPDEPLYLLRGAKLLPAPSWRTWAFWCDFHPPAPIPSHSPVAGGHSRNPSAMESPRSPSLDVDRTTPFILHHDLPHPSTWVVRHCAGAWMTLIPLHGRPFVKMGSGLWDSRFPSPHPCPRCPAWHWPWDCPSLLPVHGPRPRPPPHSAAPTFSITKVNPPPRKGRGLAHYFPPSHGLHQPVDNPAPKRPRVDSPVSDTAPPPARSDPASGRGQDLLTCGDVESNPGPEPGVENGMAVDVDAMVSVLCADEVPPAPGLLPAAASMAHPQSSSPPPVGCCISVFPPGCVVPPPTSIVLPTSTAPTPGGPASTPLDQPAPPLHPSWDEIAMDSRGTVLHIPRGALQAVTGTYVSLLNQFLTDGSWESFHALWAFPKAVLAPIGRGGKVHSAALGRKLVARATAYLGRPVALSWADSQLPPPTVARRTRQQVSRDDALAQERLHARVLRSVGNGALSKALNLLTSDGVQDASDPLILAKLRSLHPAEPPPGYGPDGARQALPSDTTDEGTRERLDQLRRAVFSFGKESAPGPSGLRSDHLKAMLLGPMADSLLTALDAFVQRCLRVGPHPAIAPILSAARLTALRKVSDRDGPPDAVGNATTVVEEGTRPIAAGETLRRLVGKTLMRHPEVTKQLKSLQPVQCGVGVPNACPLVAMAVQQWAAGLHAMGNTDWGILQLDFKNAFNSVSRAQVLSAVRKHCPFAVAWMEACYAAHSPLYCGEAIIRSERGVQQGDPCGPAAFAWAVQDLAEDLNAFVGWQAWYLDDAHILGTPLQLHQALEFVLRRASAIGLDLNLDKCQLWGPAFPADDRGSPTLPPGTPPDSPLRAVTLVPFRPDTGIKALGVPVCHPSALTTSPFARKVWSKRLKEIRKKCEALSLLPHSQVQLTLLRCCLDAKKVNDLLRATPLEQAADIVAGIGHLLRDTFSCIIGSPVSDLQWEQASLPARFGGLGIQDPGQTRASARLAGLVDFVRRARGVLGLPADYPQVPTDFSPTLLRIKGILGDQQPLLAWTQDSSLVLSADHAHLTQRWWADACARHRQGVLRASLQGDDAVRFESQTQPHAMSWVAVIPSSGLRTLLPAGDYKCVLRWSLGMSQVPEDVQGLSLACPRCNGPMDSTGHHLVCCHRNGITRRHGAVQQYVLDLAHKAGFSARREQGGEDRTRPGDVLITRLDANGPCAVDITVRHTLAPSHPLRKAADLPQWVSRQEEDKRSRYAATCRSLGWTFTPLVMDCFGAVGPDGRTLMGTLLRMLLAQREPWERRSTEADAWQGLSLALVRELGAQLRAARFLPGCDLEMAGTDGAPSGAHLPYST